MLVKPTEAKNDNKKISMIIAGVPGIGKTTLACSAPKPLVVDLDDGIDRVEAKYRVDSLKVENYKELMSDLKEINLDDYETLVIDTGGKLLEFLKPVAIKEDPKNGKTNGELSLAGYGSIKRKFKDTHSFFKSLNKHVIYLFHATEVQLTNDLTGLRIRIEGSTKDEVWDDMDLGCFMEMIGNKRTIGFSNCDRYYAKGTHGIKGTYNVPMLTDGQANDFIAKLFKLYIENMNKEVEELKAYEKSMDFKPQIEQVKSLEELKTLTIKIMQMKKILTNYDELYALVQEKAKDFKNDVSNNSKSSQ